MLFRSLHLRVGIIRHCDKPDAPQWKHPVYVLLHQLHVPREPGLRFAEDDLKLLLPRIPQHPVEIRPQAVRAGVVLV